MPLERSRTRRKAPGDLPRPGARKLAWVFAAINNVHRAIERARCEAELFQPVCEALTSATPFALAMLCVAEQDPARSVRIVAAAGEARGYLDGLMMRWDDSPLGHGPAGRAARSGEVQFNVDIEADAGFEPWRERARAFGLRSSFVLPVRLPGGAVVALLCVYSRKKAVVDRGQLEQFRLLGDDLGVCIELLRSRAALQDAWEHRRRQDGELALLQRAFESSLAAVVLTDSENRIASVNPSFETLFGYSGAELLRRKPSLLASGRHGAEYFRAMWQQLGELGHWAGEIVNRHSGGKEIVCWLDISVVRDAGGRVTHYIGSYRDVTEQVESMEAMLREQRFSNAIMDSMPGIVYMYDRNGRFRRWNRNFLEVSGYSAQELERMHPLDFFDEEHKPSLREKIVNIFDGGEETIEAPFRTKSGQTIPYQFTGRRLRYAGQDFRIGIGIDISKRKAAEIAMDAQLARLRNLSRRVLVIKESERRALGRELHDSVAQDIGAIGLNLTVVRNDLGEGVEPSIAQRLDDSERLLAEAAGRLRDVMARLRPPGLDEFGVLAALREHARRVAQRTGLAIDLAGAEPEPRLDPTAEIALFRIAQEALNNTVKHARARHVDISLQMAEGRVRLVIRDDGVGFGPEVRLVGCGRMGTLTMVERAEAVGAHCRVESAPHAGTCVTVTLPWPPAPGGD